MAKTEVDPVVQAERLIADYRQDFENAKAKWLRERTPDTWVTKRTDEELWQPRQPRINWDDDWDGILVCRVQALARKGVFVTHVYRKQKIAFRVPDGMSRLGVITLMFEIFGDSWRGISFKPAAIWWGKTSNNRWY